MDILGNVVVRSNNIILNNSGGDYVRQYLMEYFGFQYDSDVIVTLYPLTSSSSSEYDLFVRYREMLDDRPTINSGFVKYTNLISGMSTYGKNNSMAKNILYQGWKELGPYFTNACRDRFKQQNKFAFDIIISLMKNSLPIDKYKISFRPVIDYIQTSLELPWFNDQSFFNGTTRKMWYALEDITLTNLDTSKYKIILYSPKTSTQSRIIFKTYSNSNVISAGNYYKIALA